MTEQTKQHTADSSEKSFSDFSDTKLRSTMRDFLQEEDREEPDIWNAATIAGIALFLVAMFYILDLIGLEVIPGLSGAFVPLAVFGAVLIGFVGFGFFVGDRKRFKQLRKKQKDYFGREFSAEKYGSDDNINFEEELFGNASQKKTKTTSRSSHHPKNLYKSRTDNKITGVCGGLADYFGISATVIRVLFVIIFFAGYGISLLLYIALALALDKEPPEFMHDEEY